MQILKVDSIMNSERMKGLEKNKRKKNLEMFLLFLQQRTIYHN